MDLSLELYRIEKASKAQQKYFILSQMSEVEGGTHLPSGMIIEGKLNLDKVKRCFQRIIDRHEALRTALCVDDKNQIIQKIYKHVTFDLKYAEYMIDDEQIPVVLKEQIYSFDMNQPPLMHVNITKIAEDKYLMLTDLFHGVSDGYSASIIAREFMQLYQGYLLPEVTQPYSEYIRFMDEFAKTDKYAAKKAYWSKQLPKSAYTVDLPTNYERPMINKMHGKTITRKIPSDKVLELKEFAKQSKCSFYMVLLGTFEIMISKLSKQSELYLGTPVSVREVGDFAGSLGLFTNTMLIHSNVDEDQTVREFLNPLKVDCAMGFVNAEFPFEDLVEQLKFTCPMNRNPLFDVMFVYENAEERVNHISNLVCTTVDLDMEIALYDLTFELVEENGMLSLNQYFNRDLFSQEAVEQWETLYLQILDDCMANPERTIDSIELIGYQAPIVTPKRPESICNSSISIEVEDAVDKNISDASIGDASIGDASIGDTNIGDENINNETISEENLMETIEDDRKKKQCQQVIQRINQVVEQITGIRGINVNANFFEVGIRSVHALKIVDRLYENYKITITDIFKYPTIYSLACFICDIDENTVSAVKKEETKDTKDKLKQEDIAIIGIDVRLPKSRNIKEYWENLNSNNECITFFTDEELLEAGVEKALLRNPNYVKAKGVLEDAEYFDSSFFDYSPNEADKMDPQIRILHESAWKVLEDAGYCPDTYDGAIGVFVGGASNYTWTSHIFKPSSDIGERVERISLNDKDFFSTRS